ncbi:hypothetical protein [Streptomyces sp. NPDC006012]|uniref:SCO2400 family protein n=1 Tax=Streptomyces sp. NPDC006012 TaxID=3364739 RepID=UPI0036C7F7E8
MDYCTSCRRHLNGALVCPGCGAYAPDIAPDVSSSGITAAAPALPETTRAIPDGRPPAAWLRRYDTPPADEPEYVPDAAEVPPPPADDFASPAPSGEGRAARRRQRARWKKNQRRAVVATAVALVGGGLTVAAMDRHSAVRPQAATAPDNHRITLTGELPEQTASVPATPTDDATSASPSRTEDRDTGASRQRIDAAPRTVTAVVRPDAAAAPRPATTPASHAPSGTAPVHANPGTQQPSGTPTPTPPESTPAPSTPPAGTPSPSTPSTKPTQLCLLVLCLG